MVARIDVTKILSRTEKELVNRHFREHHKAKKNITHTSSQKMTYFFRSILACPAHKQQSSS